ncbi:MAG: nucleotidyltransferase family protein [Flavobacteriales bacterium]|nr:nucleotidyltransferase family protein [Flavobacteriales bacterium]
MNTIAQIRDLLIENKRKLFEKYHLRTLGIFGSYAKNQQSKDSDIDILVEFEKPIGIKFIDLAEELEKLLNTKVDLVSKNGVKKKYLDRIQQDLTYV